jgi:molybdenum cofactor cytidylyltransferase
MKFGEVPLAEAEGTVLAHGVALAGRQLKKGRTLDAADIAALADSGITQVIAARLEPGDVPEDRAAERVASALEGAAIRAAAPFTGRVNLYAEEDGVLAVDRATVDRLNALDESVTLATLPPWSVVRAGTMVATVKIIPFAVAETIVADWQRAPAPLLVAPFRRHRAALIQTRLPSLKPAVLDKTASVTAERLNSVGATLATEIRCDHRADAVAAGIVGAIEAG